MGNEVAGVTTLKLQAQDGTLKTFKAREAAKDAKNLMSVMEDGKEVVYTKVAVKNNKGEEEYKYVLLDGGKTLTPPSKSAEKDLPVFCSLGETKWDRGVDNLFDGMLQIDNTKPCSDGKDDGKISFGEKLKHFTKGCLSPLKAIIKHPFKSLAMAGLATAAALAFPIVGTALLVAGLALGVGTLGYGAYKAAATNSDAEAKAAWENIGTGTITTLMSLIGLRKAHNAAKAKQEAFPTSKKYGGHSAPKTPEKPATKEEIAKLWNITRNKTRQWERAEAKLVGLKGAEKKAQLLKIKEAKEAWQSARDAWQAAKDTTVAPAAPATTATTSVTTTPATKAEINKLWMDTVRKSQAWTKAEAKLTGLTGDELAVQQAKVSEAKAAWQAARDAWQTAKTGAPATTTTTTTTTASAPEYTGVARRLQNLGTRAKQGCETVIKSGKEVVESFNPARTFRENTLPAGQRFDGIGTQIATRAKGLGFHNVAGKGMSDIESLSQVAMQHIHNGQHWQAKDAINYMQQIVKAGKVSEADMSNAQELINAATALLGKTKAINTTPGIKTGSLIMGNVSNMLDKSATEYAEYISGAYTFA